jgi:uncharacterized membrane-anchored protein
MLGQGLWWHQRLWPSVAKVFCALFFKKAPLTYRLMLRIKVPEITPSFWITKILTTAMGEAVSDFLVSHLDPYLAVALGAAAFLAALALQLATRRYIAPAYWLLVAMVAVFGTMTADAVHVALGVPYALSTAGFALALGVVFLAWLATEGTLSIHSIATRRRELFYWATVIATFALGTAAGDFTAATLALGYLVSGLLFGAAFALPWIGFRYFRLNGVAAFWAAYVLTRPLGASFADWFDKPRGMSGLGLGTGPVAAALSIAVILAIAWISWHPAANQQRTPV